MGLDALRRQIPPRTDKHLVSPCVVSGEMLPPHTIGLIPASGSIYSISMRRMSMASLEEAAVMPPV
jgi:hypothetical protein